MRRWYRSRTGIRALGARISSITVILRWILIAIRIPGVGIVGSAVGGLEAICMFGKRVECICSVVEGVECKIDRRAHGAWRRIIDKKGSYCSKS